MSRSSCAAEPIVDTLESIYPVPAALFGSAFWMKSAALDTATAREGVWYFKSIHQLLRDHHADMLLKFLWRALDSNFEGVDGVRFYCCARGTDGWPQTGELVAVCVQQKTVEKLQASVHVDAPCLALPKLYVDELWNKWKQCTALVVVSRTSAPPRLDVPGRSKLALDSFIFVDGDCLADVYGSTLSLMAKCADTHSVDDRICA